MDLQKLIKRLSLEEKISLVTGHDAWHTKKIERLGIPSIKMSDGPNGVRGDSESGKTSACFPCPISLASTWNLDLIYKVGVALGEEANSKDVDVLLGPTINIHRHPLGGRHFESFSEDPVLSGKIAIAYVEGVQSKKVATCLKHFIGNDTEFERHQVSSNIDERTLREIYLLPFEMAIKEGKAMVIMSAYNKLNNIYCSSHEFLLRRILKDEWQFLGYVVSDWGAAIETIENANGGLDLEMPGPGNNWGVKLVEAINSGYVKEKTIDEKIERLLRVAEFTGRLKNPKQLPEQANDQKGHRDLIRNASSQGMVLLKNEDLLPFNSKKIKKLAVIGPNAKDSQIIGGGSAGLKPHYSIHPLEGIVNLVNDSMDISYAKGCHTYKYLPEINSQLLNSNKNNQSGYLVKFFEEDLDQNLLKTEVLCGNKFWALQGFAIDLFDKEIKPNLSVRFSGTYSPDISGLHEFEIFSIGLSRLKVNGIEIIDNWTSQSPGEAFFGFASMPKRSTIEFEKGISYFIEIEYKWQGRFPAIQIGCKPPDRINLMQEACDLANKSDAVILIVGTNSDWETEGNDRSSLSLPSDQDNLIKSILNKNKNTLIVLNSGSPVSMPWITEARAVLQSWFPGQEFGNSLAEIVFGLINPSGKLPTTFPLCIEDTPAYSSYPGNELQMNYDEKLLVGYKWYEKKNVRPLFPFGHGLSYTTFEFKDLIISFEEQDEFLCSFEITNKGKFAGYETAQCYIGHVDVNDEEPNKHLTGFSKVFLQPGESLEVNIKLHLKDFSIWDVSSAAWKRIEGKYLVSIGSSSEDIKLKQLIDV